MTEASLTQTASSLRCLFAMILDFNHPEDALGLWASHRDAMVDDKIYSAQQERHIRAIPDFAVLENEALWDVECILPSQAKSLRDFGWVHASTPPTRRDPTTSVMAQELMWCQLANKADAARDLERCNIDQARAFKAVTEAFELPPHQPKAFFLYAAGGFGKTYLLNLLLRHFRANGHIAVATAMTGIAALLLDEGTTAHSRFGVPLQ